MLWSSSLPDSFPSTISAPSLPWTTLAFMPHSCRAHPHVRTPCTRLSLCVLSSYSSKAWDRLSPTPVRSSKLPSRITKLLLAWHSEKVLSSEVSLMHYTWFSLVCHFCYLWILYENPFLASFLVPKTRIFMSQLKITHPKMFCVVIQYWTSGEKTKSNPPTKKNGTKIG